MRAIGFLVAVAGLACRTPYEPGWLPYSVDQAAKHHRPLVVEFSATWCGACKIFERKVLSDARVQEALTHVEFMSFDIETAAGRDAWGRCQGKSLPTVVGIDTHGVVRLLKHGTESTPDQFLEFLAEAQRVLGTPD